MNTCKECGSETSNPKFCSRSCAATFNNRKYPKKKLDRVCEKEGCDDVVFSWRSTLCKKHHDEYKSWRGESLKKKTIGEFRNRKSVNGKHPSWKHAGVRTLNRSWNKHLIELPCKRCGYKLHVELCHIRPVSEFPDNALMGEVNGEENNVQLCRNCHWELDNGYFKIGDIV
jgi:hypothetical protein